MTVEQFDRQYGQRKPYFEYWFGEPVQKARPTWIHSLLQKIIMRLVDEAGYESGAELKLKLSPHFQPLPDVSAVLPGQVETPFPTSPVEVVVEILSPDDQRAAIISKCRFYRELGIQSIYVVNPETREIYRWGDGSLRALHTLLTIPATEIWRELDLRLRKLRLSG
jgi:Uma2 family endonuclease